MNDTNQAQTVYLGEYDGTTECPQWTRLTAPNGGGRVARQREADAAMAKMVREWSHPDCPA